MNSHRRIALVGSCIALMAPGVQAQLPDGCTYDRCALRFEEPHLVRGARGEPVARLSWWSSPELARIVQRSDSALYHARIAESRHGRGAAAGVIGMLAAGAAVLWAGGAGGIADAAAGPLVLATAGLGAGIYSEYELREARRALARSVWWYNRDLPR